MNRKHLYLGLLFSLAATLAFADGLPIDPGMWEMTTTMNMPMMPQPRVSTRRECLEESEISPDAINERDMDSSCTFDTRMVDSNSMSWSMDCNEQAGASHGEWEATSQGDTLTGQGTVTVNMQGQAMVLSMKWDGKRVGDCD